MEAADARGYATALAFVTAAATAAGGGGAGGGGAIGFLAGAGKGKPVKIKGSFEWWKILLVVFGSIIGLIVLGCCCVYCCGCECPDDNNAREASPSGPKEGRGIVFEIVADDNGSGGDDNDNDCCCNDNDD